MICMIWDFLLRTWGLLPGLESVEHLAQSLRSFPALLRGHSWDTWDAACMSLSRSRSHSQSHFFDRIRGSCLGVSFLLLLPVSYLRVSFMPGFCAIFKSCPRGPWAGLCSSIRLMNIAALLGGDEMPNEVSQKRSSVSSDVFDFSSNVFLLMGFCLFCSDGSSRKEKRQKKFPDAKGLGDFFPREMLRLRNSDCCASSSKNVVTLEADINHITSKNSNCSHRFTTTRQQYQTPYFRHRTQRTLLQPQSFIPPHSSLLQSHMVSAVPVPVLAFPTLSTLSTIPQAATKQAPPTPLFQLIIPDCTIETAAFSGKYTSDENPSSRAQTS